MTTGATATASTLAPSCVTGNPCTSRWKVSGASRWIRRRWPSSGTGSEGRGASGEEVLLGGTPLRDLGSEFFRVSLCHAVAGARQHRAVEQRFGVHLHRGATATDKGTEGSRRWQTGKRFRNGLTPWSSVTWIRSRVI